jgi:hypothetical protein
MKGRSFKIVTIWICITTAIGAFSVADLSLYFGYRLFLAGVTGQFKFAATIAGGSVGLESIAPGVGFALFGMFVAICAIRRLIAGPR